MAMNIDLHQLLPCMGRFGRMVDILENLPTVIHIIEKPIYIYVIKYLDILLVMVR